MTKSLKAVIFDLDGVIVDTHPIHKKSWKRFLELLGRHVDDRELDFILDGQKKEEILRHFLGNMSQEQVLEYGRQKEQLFREEALEIEVVAGFQRFLDDLDRHSISAAVASCGSTGRVHYILDRLQLSNRFVAIVTGDDVHHGKPDPTIFRLAADKLQCRCEESLVIEDGISGVRAAKAAGMKCFGIAQDDRIKLLKEAGADWVLPSFAGLSVSTINQLLHPVGFQPTMPATATTR